MKFFLDDLFGTLTGHKRERAGDILDEVALSKDQVQAIATRLSSMQDFSPITLNTESPFGDIQGGPIQQNFRSLHARMADMYQLSDLISLIIDSENAILSAEIETLEQQLNALQKMSDNYSFLLADGKTFNFAYLEPFNNELGRDTFTFNVPDRASQVFQPLDQAVVLSDEGVLALSTGITHTQPATGSISASNASSFLINDTGINQALDLSSATGWIYTLKSPQPITSSLPGVDAIGAQVKLEFILNTPAAISEVRFAPISDSIVDLIQVTIVPNHLVKNSGADSNLLTAPLHLDRTVALRFPLKSVAKVEVVLNQPTYQRNLKNVNIPEERHNKIWANMRSRKRGPKTTLTPALDFLVKKNAPISWKYTPTPNAAVQWGPLFLDRIVANANCFKSSGLDSAWTEQDPQSGFILNSVFSQFPQWSSSLSGNATYYAGQFDPRSRSGQYQWAAENPNENFYQFNTAPPIPQTADSFVINTVQSDYQYVLGLQNISFGVNTPNFKGVFVSQPMQVAEQISVVRLKTAEQNFLQEDPNLDANLTSVEYSVSAVSAPQKETDWLPIMPIDHVSVEAERFFPDVSGLGYLRFPADLNEPIRLFKNRSLVSLEVPQWLIYGLNKQSIIGLKLPHEAYTSNDILTIDYTPATDYTTIDFNANGFDDIPLIAAHDADGAGEGFSGTIDRNTVVLKATPYLDYTQIKTSTYDAIDGMLPYQPVRVAFEDGSIPTNLTNYIAGGSQSPLPSSNDEFFFLHSDNVLIFNQQVSQPFRAYYEYLQNTVRVRTVLRVNDKTFVSPKVDFFHLKAKTRRPIALS